MCYKKALEYFIENGKNYELCIDVLTKMKENCSYRVVDVWLPDFFKIHEKVDDFLGEEYKFFASTKILDGRADVSKVKAPVFGVLSSGSLMSEKIEGEKKYHLVVFYQHPYRSCNPMDKYTNICEYDSYLYALKNEKLTELTNYCHQMPLSEVQQLEFVPNLKLAIYVREDYLDAVTSEDGIRDSSHAKAESNSLKIMFPFVLISALIILP